MNIYFLLRSNGKKMQKFKRKVRLLFYFQQNLRN